MSIHKQILELERILLYYLAGSSYRDYISVDAGKSILARVSARFELALVRVIGIRLYLTRGKKKYTKLGCLTWAYIKYIFFLH